MPRKKALAPPPPPAPRHPLRRALALVPLLAAAAAATALWQGGWTVPTRHDPWAPLVLADPPGWLTRYKLQRLDRDPAQCRAVLATAPLSWQPVPDREGAADGCGWAGAVRVQSGGALAFSSPFTLACPAAVSLALWERHALQPAAQQHLASRVARIDHVGSYACRNVNHAAGGQRSQHAFANALDVTAFTLADGTRVSVLKDWPGDGPASAFLHGARDGACRFFNGVLGPDYNAAHRDHLHLDRGRYGICR